MSIVYVDDYDPEEEEKEEDSEEDPLTQDEDLKKYKGTYTKYAIYIDKHIPDIAEPYKNPEIENRIYNYIYSICYVLACKKKFFYKVEDYKAFSLYAAGEFYLMFRDRYVNQGKVRRGKVVKPIKSSLNIIKRVLYAFKVEYSKKFFHQIYKDDWGEEGENIIRKELERRKKAAVSNFVRSNVEKEYNYLLDEAIEETCNNLPTMIQEIIEDTPYKKDKVMKQALYKTCLLSFINSITFPNKILAKLQNKMNFDQIAKKYKKERDNCIILWHLEEDMVPYVQLLLAKIRDSFAEKIEEDVCSYSLKETTIDDILSTSYNTYDTDQSDEEFS